MAAAAATRAPRPSSARRCAAARERVARPAVVAAGRRSASRRRRQVRQRPRRLVLELAGHRQGDAGERAGEVREVLLVRHEPTLAAKRPPPLEGAGGVERLEVETAGDLVDATEASTSAIQSADPLAARGAGRRRVPQARDRSPALASRRSGGRSSARPPAPRAPPRRSGPSSAGARHGRARRPSSGPDRAGGPCVRMRPRPGGRSRSQRRAAVRWRGDRRGPRYQALGPCRRTSSATARRLPVAAPPVPRAIEPSGLRRGQPATTASRLRLGQLPNHFSRRPGSWDVAPVRTRYPALPATGPCHSRNAGDRRVPGRFDATGLAHER